MKQTAVPEWLEAEFTRAALAGETCSRCGSPDWICHSLGAMVHGLQGLHDVFKDPAAAAWRARICLGAALGEPWRDHAWFFCWADPGAAS